MKYLCRIALLGLDVLVVALLALHTITTPDPSPTITSAQQVLREDADASSASAERACTEAAGKYQEMLTAKTDADKAKANSQTWYNDRMWFVQPVNQQLYKSLVEDGNKEYMSGDSYAHQGNGQWMFGDGYKKTAAENYAFTNWSQAKYYYDLSAGAYGKARDYYDAARHHYREAQSRYLASMQTGN